MAIETSTTKSETLNEQIKSDGVIIATINARLDDSRAGNFGINFNVMNEATYQGVKSEVEPVIQDFINDVIAQAMAQEYTDTTVTSETAPVSEDTAETVSTTKSKSSKK